MVRLVRFVLRSAFAPLSPSIGALNAAQDHVIDLTTALAPQFGALRSTREFLALGAQALDAAKRAVSEGKHAVAVERVRFVAPIHDCDKLLCVGMNYEDHCIEQNFPIPTEPIIFNKFASSIVPSGHPIHFTKATKKLDFEVELAVVIGKAGFEISKEDAMQHVGGYAVAHDVSERYWQLERNGGQWLVGKTFNTYCPLGPIVTPDEVGDPHSLRLRCLVNGQVMQDSNTNQLIFKVPELIAWCSQFFTLLPGDVILTGTPPGVGVFRKPPVFLREGDEVVCDIEKLGAVTNRVEAVNSKL